MRTLSISIPTYNRPSQLKALNERFLSKVLDEYGDLVEIIVFDNSDAEIALQNRSNLDQRVQYTYIPANIGIANSLVRCIELATGRYIWLLSDDDDILWDGFVALIEALKLGQADCYLVSYLFTTDLNEKIAQRYMFLKPGETHVVSNLFPKGQFFLPFALLSAGVVRLDKSAVPELKKQFEGNLFIHMLMFMSMLKDDSPVEVVPPLVDYNSAYRIRFDIVAVFMSYFSVTEHLERRFKNIHETRELYFAVALASSIDLLIRHRTGLIRLNNVKGARKAILKAVLKHPDRRCFSMLMVTFLPAWLGGWWHTLFLAKMYALRPHIGEGTKFTSQDLPNKIVESSRWNRYTQNIQRFRRAIQIIRDRIESNKKSEAIET